MASSKEMLSAVLKKAQLSAQDREAMEDIWDKLHRYGDLTSKQKAWVEKIYFAQKLDREGQPKPQPQAQPKFDRKKSGTFLGTAAQAKQHKIGFINYSGTRETLLITNMTMLTDLCPSIKPGSKQYTVIERFFRNGGQVLKIKPVKGFDKTG